MLTWTCTEGFCTQRRLASGGDERQRGKHQRHSALLQPLLSPLYMPPGTSICWGNNVYLLGMLRDLSVRLDFLAGLQLSHFHPSALKGEIISMPSSRASPLPFSLKLLQAAVNAFQVFFLNFSAARSLGVHFEIFLAKNSHWLSLPHLQEVARNLKYH